ncbi:MAG: type I glyceraldehyde-3-phosphate dehydrogenase [Alphaproteobacteria bacterium]|nr:type I glyceraldehyde-3-phosphate dehydrogenase [Alphaproteobacteria bacterium]NCQ87960.1 type I glyceraldehyde-3-phosphate dehydrogenase [Alphaproteobacteria bacterium]NCT05533.1 type I glyceraldehyde-3-phosphate dehydrogenase [Alphaproteobacteria bacterium]
MTVRVAINGFGRIGRNVMRALFESGRTDVEIVAINDLAPLETNKHLLKYDSVHGTFGFSVERIDEDTMIVEGKHIDVFQERDPTKLPWGKMKVDIVFECTGIFTDREKAAMHIQAGAKKVLISAPSGDADIMTVYGVNSDKIKAEHEIVSNASCTTNCLAPVAKALNDAIGIESGFMTTIHSYTGDQQIVDTAHKDLHRARAGALNMIPTSTGAAKAVGKVLPELNGKLDGVSMRVPTPNVSVVDLKFVASKNTTVEEVNKAIIAAAGGDLGGILGTYDEPLVSGDFNHNPLSSIFALNETKVINGNLVRIMSWYDNEWGFSNRMLDTAVKMHAVGYTASKSQAA